MNRPLQLSLLAESRNIVQAAAFTRVIKASLRRMVDESGKSRDQVLDLVNAIIQAGGVRLTKGRARLLHRDTLDKWMNPEDSEHVPGLLALHVLCLALGSNLPLGVWLSMLEGNAEIMTDEDRRLRDYGKAILEREQADQHLKRTRQKIKEVFK
ncbi:hypothetical protein LJC36_00130 [Desulfovibrio sp. OttesenSCG-928-C14]|nr:hypothetical protein [Desulfovibrio sp. OttesenSCG-928-C14]